MMPSVASFKVLKITIFLWLLAAGFIIFVSAFYVFALKPEKERLAYLEGEYLLKRKSTSVGSTDIEGESKKYYGRIPKWEDFTKVMGDIYNKAERLNLLVESATYRPEAVKGTGIIKVTVSMPVTGAYGEIKRFIYELEASPRLFIIEDLSLGSGRYEENMVSLKLNIAIHFKG